jgi:hypothetical protein
MVAWRGKPAKYHNVKTVLDGMTFDSKAEARRYAELALLKKAGELTTVGCQPSFVVAQGIRYIPDFICVDKAGKVWVEDVKGMETQAFKLKKKLFEAAYPGIELRIIGRR